MSSFDDQVQIEEVIDYVPTAEDWAEYAAWLDSQQQDANDSDEKVSE